jgi:hypothetical protein
MVLNELLLASLFFQQENISKASITFASGERSVVRGKHGRATERDAIRKAGVSKQQPLKINLQDIKEARAAV